MTTAKGTATRERILDAAVDALVHGGAGAVHLDEVMATTRTSKGQIFHYFPGGKRELVRAATERQLERLTREATEPLDSLDAWEEWTKRVIGLHRAQTRADACEVAAIAGRILDADPAERELLGTSLRTWHAHLADGVRDMQHAGVLRGDADPSAIAALFLTAVQGGAVIDKATASVDYLEPALDAALAHLRSFAADGL